VGADGAQRSSPVLIERTLPHTIIVNTAGNRFCNEANNYSSLAGAFHAFDPAAYDYPNLPAFLIFDHQYRQRYPLGMVMPGAPLPDWIASAVSLDALADAIGVDGVQLARTVADFNAHACCAEDPQFGRGKSRYDRFYGDRSRPGAAATLGPIEAAPYYAVELKMGALGTNGGPRTNASAQILDVDGEPIPGLFGAGNVISCPTGSVYAGAGGTLGPALTFGYIAGRAAARLANH
jgi:3-oxosteroid 1-dehydrogenase